MHVWCTLYIPVYCFVHNKINSANIADTSLFIHYFYIILFLLFNILLLLLLLILCCFKVPPFPLLFPRTLHLWLSTFVTIL